MRRLAPVLIAALLVACGGGGSSPAPAGNGTFLVGLDAELPDLNGGPLGGLEFAMTFSSDEIINIAANELILAPDEPAQITLPAATWIATATAYTLSDVVDPDGNTDRLGQAGESCSHEVELHAGQTILLEVVFRLGERCSVSGR